MNKVRKVQLVATVLMVPLVLRALLALVVQMASELKAPSDHRDQLARQVQRDRLDHLARPVNGAPRAIPDRRVPRDRKDRRVRREPMEPLVRLARRAPTV